MAETDTSSSTLAPRKGLLLGAVSCAIGLCGLLWFLVQNIDRINQYGLGAPTYLVYLSAGVLSGLLLFGAIEGSTAHLSGEWRGAKLRVGGPGALALAVLGGGILYEIQQKEKYFGFAIYFHDDASPASLLKEPGEVTVLLDSPHTSAIKNGYSRIDLVPNSWRGKTVPISIDVRGYASSTPTTISLQPDATYHVSLKKNESTKVSVDGFEVYLPGADWTASQEWEDSRPVLEVSPPGTGKCTLALQAKSTRNPNAAWEMLHFTKETMTLQRVNERKRPVRVGTLDGLEIRYHSTIDKVEFEYLVVLVGGARGCYLIACYAERSAFTALLPGFESLIRSFREV